MSQLMSSVMSSVLCVAGGGVCADQLSVLVSVSELLSRQRVACVSNLSWSTNQQRVWAKEAELSVPGQRALQRVNLLLIGCLREGGGGAWRLEDASGNVSWECLSPSPLWLNRPVFLPHWNYIPHNAPGPAEAGGCVELIGSPVLLSREQGLAAVPGGAGLSGAVGVRQAAGLLTNSLVGYLSVCVSTCLSLYLSVSQDSGRLWWTQCVCVGQSVCVTALRVCVLRGWRGNNILCVTDRSEIHTNYTLTDPEPPSDTPPPLMMSHNDDDDCEEAEPERDAGQSAVRMKKSRVISYQGTVTEVVSEGAGLYVIDRKVGLCLAYQPTPRRKLRAGDSVELHHVHFLYRPCPDFPPSMLCTCLRSSLRVSAFSRAASDTPDARCPADGALPRLLLEKNMGVSEYLWACHLSSQLEEEMGSECVCVCVCVCVCFAGCLVCVQQFTMVTERFLQSDFPSYQHLDQDEFITHKHCRVYLQFSLDDLHILSPSVAMVTHLRQKGAEPGGEVTGRKRRREEEEEPGSSHSASSSSHPCVSMVIRVEQKEGVAWRNTGAGLKEEEVGLTPSFSVRAAVIGPVVSWGRDPKNEPMTEREKETEREDKVRHLGDSVSSRWFPVLQPSLFYRLIATNTQDPSVLIGCGVSGRRGVELHTDSTLQVRSDWRFHTLTRPLSLLTCPQVNTGLIYILYIYIYIHSVVTAADICVRLSVCDQTGRSLQVYLDLSHTPYPPGLLPGNTLLLSGFQRRVSSSPRPPPAPMMHLGVWALSREQRCIVGQVKGHVVCFLLLQLQWSCSLCGSVYIQSCSSPQCRSTSSVFQSKAKLVIDDGTGEAHVWFSGAVVRPLLGLADSQWEGLQRALRVRGHVRVFPRGRSMVSTN
uniref:CST complex subunit CTC1 n=1 Tax=Sander lucioperca TaxID=283035 RepID=A0A8C9ZYJ2_SANLU